MQVDEFVFRRQMTMMQYHGANIYHIDQVRIMMLLGTNEIMGPASDGATL